MAFEFSIVTAIHNGLPMNEVFWETLCENTVTPFELILVDNHSSDGSEKYFQNIFLTQKNPQQRLVYLRNEKNQSYPDSQIQGMKHCTKQVLCFLNNDTWMPAGWELPLIREVLQDPLLVVSPSGQEAQPTQERSDILKQRWKRWKHLSKLWRFFTASSKKDQILWAVKKMYGDLKQFRSPTPQLKTPYFNGIKGDCVAFHRELLKYVVPWDSRITASDWHLYLTLASLHDQNPEIPLPRVLLDSYVHHYGRYSEKLPHEPVDRSQFISIDDHWGVNTVKRLWWGNSLPAR